MPLIQTKGSASSQAYGQFARQAPAANYIEDVFSTYLYTGTAATQTITNGIDFLGKGGMVWIKARTTTTYNNNMVWATDMNGGFRYLQTNTTGAWTTDGNGAGVLDATGRKSNGFQLASTNLAANANTVPYVSWSFRKQAKFFDVVTWTGNGTLQNISHNLGSVPGCIIVKRTDAVNDWCVYHRSLLNSQMLSLNLTDSVTTTAAWNNTTPTSTQFTVGANTLTNANGGTYVAYLFAHDAGGFGAAGTDSVIKCGTWLGNGSVEEVNLGWEPQFILYKSTSAAGNWFIRDNMRGWGVDIAASSAPNLFPNLSSAESSGGGPVITPTGFKANLGIAPGYNYIYIAIRRGPMRTPTSGTSVYSNLAYTGDQTDNRILSQGSSAPNDLFMFMDRTNGAGVFSSNGLGSPVYDRLRGISVSNTSASKTATALGTQFTNAETGVYAFTLADTQTNFSVSANFGALNTSAVEMVVQMFRRAPGFFDVVCYTGDGTNPRNISHNLGAVPELMLVKRRGPNTQNWLVYHGALGAAAGLVLNTTAAATNPAFYWSATPTSTQFSTQLIPNSSGENYVAYLFASCPGVSKVGSYTGTGTGTTQQINCGFTGGARFVMIKRTDSTGAWYVWDSARGIVAGNDPYLLLNSTISEVTATDYIDTLSTGFEISIFAPNAINANGGTFIYLAIA